MTAGENLIVTGIPRSGTTLVTALIDALEDAVGISEPVWQSRWSRDSSSAERYCDRLRDDFRRVRRTLAGGGVVLDRRREDGSALTSYYRRLPGDAVEPDRRPVPFSRPGLSRGFLLAMKHNAHYSCVLPALVRTGAFSVLAVVRHPVPTLLSWRSLSLPISRGRLPAAERFWPEISRARERSRDLLRVQVEIYDLFCGRYLSLRPRLDLLRYEDLLERPDGVESLLARRRIRSVAISPRDWADGHEEAEVDRVRDYVRRFCPNAAALYPDVA